MDFLDPKKQRSQQIIFGIGYTLIAIAILIATTILLYQAYGFGFNKDGQIIQSGLVFFSTQPSPANIYLNGQLNKNQTNTRQQLPAGDYNVQLKRAGYRTWQRSITVEGADVQHFDYPFLVPQKLATTTIKTYSAASPLTTQTPDRHFELVESASVTGVFTQYDLNNTAQVKTTTQVAIPDDLLTAPSGEQSLQVAEWSTDNKHVLLIHNYDGNHEYILFNRDSPASSLNLTNELKLNQSDTITLRNRDYDKYFVLDSSNQALSTADISSKALTPYLDKVLAYKSYGVDTVLYATNQDATPGKAQIILKQNGTSYPIREISAAPPYLLDLTKYSGALYTAVGASGDNMVYVYQDPVAARQHSPQRALVPASILRVTAPNYVSFSDNARFIVTENGQQFAVYDAENDKRYTYTLPTALDAPQQHATWMDGHRLELVTGGKLTIFDYDHANVQTLVPANPAYVPAFDRNYKYLYTLTAPGSNGSTMFTSTPMVTPQDI